MGTVPFNWGFVTLLEGCDRGGAVGGNPIIGMGSVLKDLGRS